MTKEEVQKRVLHNDNPIDLDEFYWEEKNMVFISKLDFLIINFQDVNDVTFKVNDFCIVVTGDHCLIITNKGSDIKTGQFCQILTWNYCKIETSDNCFIETGNSSKIKTGQFCQILTGNWCEINTLDNCYIDEGLKCIKNPITLEGFKNE